MTPRNGQRQNDDEWRATLEEKMDGQHARLNKAIDALTNRFETLSATFVSKESLKYQLDNINDRYEPIRSSSVWLMRIIVGGFLAALAQYVYVHAK